MPTADARGTRLACIPIFETLGLRLGLTGDGTATLTALYDPAYNGIFKALERVLDEGRECSEVLQIISAARCAVNSLMTELMEGHIRHHVLDPKRKPNSEQTHAADEVIDMVKTYLR